MVYSMNRVSKPLLIRNTLKNYNTDMCVWLFTFYCHCDSPQKGLGLFVCV